MFSLDIKTPDTKLVAIWRYNTYEKYKVHASTQYDYVNRPVVGTVQERMHQGSYITYNKDGTNSYHRHNFPIISTRMIQL